MAREKCRYVSTSFWDDEWIQSLDPSEKLLYLYLLTNPLTTIAGIYKITVRRMCFDTGFNTDTIGHILGKLEKAGKVFMFNGWLILPNWPKHQKVGKDDNNRKGIDTILKSLPDDVFQFIVQHGYTYQYINDLGRTVQAPYKPLIRPSDYINLNLNSNLNSNSNGNRNIPAEEEAPQASPAPQKRFQKPTFEEVSAYCKERGNTINPQSFIDFYVSNGWKVGKNAMKDWRAAVRTWEQRDDGKQKPARKLTWEEVAAMSEGRAL